MWNKESLFAALTTIVSVSENLSDNMEINNISIDSRNIGADDLFIALKGKVKDGHDYITQAIDAGAICCILEKKPDFEIKTSYIVVPNSLNALNELANYARSKIKGKVIGITGSVGKTSVKEMLKCMLSMQGNVYATKGNLNNNYGVPLTLANMPFSTEFAIIEMGMNAPGEISFLSKLTKPDVAIVTTVASNHLEFFSSVSAIASAKAEIIDGLPPHGTLIINMDNPYTPIIRNYAIGKKLNIISFGSSKGTDFEMINLANIVDGMEITVHTLVGNFCYFINTYGRHMALNSLAALAAIYSVGGELEFSLNQLKNFNSLVGRGKIHYIKSRNITIIDETYNASPESMVASMEAASLSKNTGKRLVAVLGDMTELGLSSEQLHLSLKEPLIDKKFAAVYTVGEHMQLLAKTLPDNIEKSSWMIAEEAAKNLPNFIQDNDVIMIKGSNSTRMNIVLQSLLEGI